MNTLNTQQHQDLKQAVQELLEDLNEMVNTQNEYPTPTEEKNQNEYKTLITNTTNLQNKIKTTATEKDRNTYKTIAKQDFNIMNNNIQSIKNQLDAQTNQNERKS